MNRFSINASFRFLIALVLLGGGVSSGLNYVAGQHNTERLERLEVSLLPALELRVRLKYHFHSVRDHLRTAFDSGEDNTLAAAARNQRALEFEFKRGLSASPDEQDLIHLQERVLHYYALALRLVPRLHDEGLRPDFTQGLGQLGELFLEVDQSFDAAISQHRLQLASQLAETRRTQERSAWLTIATEVLVVLLVVFLVFLIMRRLLAGFEKLRLGFVRIGAGDFSSQIEIGGKDELATLANRGNLMATQLRETTLSRDYVENIVGAMADMLIVVDPEGTIQTVNNVGLRLLGLHEDQIIGRPFESFVVDNHLGGTRLSDLVEWGSVNGREITFYGAGHGVIPMNVTASAMRDGHSNLVGVVLVARDMRESIRLMRAASDSAKAARAKSKELAELNEELSKAQATLAQSAKLSALGELGAGIAHELNQPLTVINGIAQLTLDEKHLLPPKLAGNIAMVHYEAERMAIIINNIKTFARETAGEYTPMRLHDSVRKAIGLVNEQCKANGVWIKRGDYDESLMIEGDALVLQQVLINLILNSKDALLESPSNGKEKSILLSLVAAGSQVVLRVEDSGPGIPDHVASRVFEPFFTTKGIGGGTGLGLSITYGIVEKHGGSISVVPSTLGGAGFELVFPQWEGQEPTAAPAPAQMNLSQNETVKLTVLLVDDDALVRQIVTAILEKMGCQVTSVDSGKEALKVLESQQFNLLVTDFMMPELSGEELIAEIHSRGHQLPVVVMTGARTERLITLARDVGALDCIEKPIDRRKMRAILHQIEKEAKDISAVPADSATPNPAAGATLD